MSKNKTTYRLTVEYEGFDQEFDKKIEKTIKRECDGSGFGFGGRDLGFYYKTKLSAVNARRKLKNRFRSKIQCQIYEDRN